jgi:hypothetical protein
VAGGSACAAIGADAAHRRAHERDRARSTLSLTLVAPNDQEERMVKHFDHLTIVVQDVDRAKAFSALLGFKEAISVVIAGEPFASYTGVPGLMRNPILTRYKGRNSTYCLWRTGIPRSAPARPWTGSAVIRRSRVWWAQAPRRVGPPATSNRRVPNRQPRVPSFSFPSRPSS